MSSSATQESPHNAALRAITTRLDEVDKRMAVLHQIDADGHGYDVPLGEKWQPLTGRTGVQVYHIPNPNGAPGLFMTAFAVEPGAAYAGSRIMESRLLGTLDGDLHCNDELVQVGRFLWLPPQHPTSWSSQGGALGVVYYNSPNPDSFTS